MHGETYALFVGAVDCFFVTSISVAKDAPHGVVGQHSSKSAICGFRSVGNNDLSSMLAEANANTTAMMEGDPRRARSNVGGKVQQPLRRTWARVAANSLNEMVRTPRCGHLMGQNADKNSRCDHQWSQYCDRKLILSLPVRTGGRRMAGPGGSQQVSSLSPSHTHTHPRLLSHAAGSVMQNEPGVDQAP